MSAVSRLAGMASGAGCSVTVTTATHSSVTTSLGSVTASMVTQVQFTDRQTERQAERQTDRLTETDSDNQPHTVL